jgi:hypothetical protein
MNGFFPEIMFDENIHFALSEAALKIENVHQYAKFLNM